MFKRTAVPPVGPSEHQARQPLNMALDFTMQVREAGEGNLTRDGDLQTGVRQLTDNRFSMRKVLAARSALVRGLFRLNAEVDIT
jgi:hypothetical protein